MSSNNTSNSDENHSHIESRRTKRRRISSDSDLGQSSSSSTTNVTSIRWTSPSEQQTYSSKLLEALRHVRRRNSQAPSVSGSSAVRAAADTALAAAAKGRTRWSRAVLSRRTKLLLKNHRKAAKLRPKFPPANETRRKLSAGGDNPKSLSAVERKVKVLGRLVPGCRKLPFQNLLEEATDYIAALQMQVRAMAALADLLAGSTEGASSSSSNNPVGPVQMS